MRAVNLNTGSLNFTVNLLGFSLLVIACVVLATLLFGSIYTVLSEIFLDTAYAASDPKSYY